MDWSVLYSSLAFITVFFVAGPYIVWKQLTATGSDGTVVKGGAMFLTLFAAMLFFLALIIAFSLVLEEFHLACGLLLFIVLFILIEFEIVRKGLARLTGLGGE